MPVTFNSSLSISSCFFSRSNLSCSSFSALSRASSAHKRSHGAKCICRVSALMPHASKKQKRTWLTFLSLPPCLLFLLCLLSFGEFWALFGWLEIGKTLLIRHISSAYVVAKGFSRADHHAGHRSLTWPAWSYSKYLQLAIFDPTLPFLVAYH